MAPPAAKLCKRKNKNKSTEDGFEVVAMFGSHAPNGKSD
jgi:hypothetical protein